MLFEDVIAALGFHGRKICVICEEQPVQKKLRTVSLSHYGVRGTVLQAYSECPQCGEFCGSTEMDLGAEAIRRFKRYAERPLLN